MFPENTEKDLKTKRAMNVIFVFCVFQKLKAVNLYIYNLECRKIKFKKRGIHYFLENTEKRSETQRAMNVILLVFIITRVDVHVLRREQHHHRDDCAGQLF